MKCTSCGNELKEGAKYCPLCGHPAGQEEAPARMHPPEKDPVTIIKSSESGKPSRKGPLLAAAAAAILLLLLILPRFLKGDPRARLEEQLRLGAAYLEEMNFDMALDAYAAVIEIDENEPRAYLGRAGVYRALAAQTAENAETEEDLNAARNYADLAGEDTDHAEEIIQSDEYGQGEDSPVTPEDIEASRKENEDLLNIILRRIIQITEVDVDAVVQEVLSLPYIGNTSYGEYMTEASADLYDGEGYISAVLMDLDGDEQDEILVISLEGEDALGGGNNAMYLHVLEYSGEDWAQTAVRNIETDPQSMLLSSYRMQPLNRDIFLRQEEDITVVYAETSASDYASYTSRAWSLFRYIYDGEGIDLAGIGDTAPGEAEVDGHFYLFDRETAMYVPDGAPDQAARIWDVFDKISAAGIPILKDGSLVAGVMRSDPSFIPMASFSRKVNTDYDAADPYQGTSVRLIDWIIRSTGDLTEAQEFLLYENFFLGLVQQAGYSVENARAFFTYYDVNVDGLYEMFTNITGQPQKIYTIREGQVTDISPDYTPEADETVSLGVEADGTIYMVTAKNPQWDQYHNYYTAADYTVYDLSFTDTDVSMEEAASFRGSYTNIGRRSYLHWFYDPAGVSFNISRLVYRLNTLLKYEYSFDSRFSEEDGVVSGTVSKAPGDGYSFGGRVEIRLEEKTATVYYDTEMESYRATEQLDLK